VPTSTKSVTEPTPSFAICGLAEGEAIVLAIEESIKTETLGWRGMAFLAREAARVIRELRPDLAFKE